MVEFYDGLLDQLTLHVRHRAWLNAKPTGAKQSRLETFKVDEERGVSRRELVLPPLDAGDYLVNYLFEVGPSTGEGPITHLEIAAWCALTGRELEPWEVQTLRRMSGAYLGEAHDATDPKRPAPAWVSATPSKEAVSDTIESILNQFEKQDGPKGKRRA